MAQIHALTPEGRLPSAAVGHAEELIDATDDENYGGFIGTGGDLNLAIGRAQRSTLYDIRDFGVGIANMPPNPYQGMLEVLRAVNGRRLIQRVTYDDTDAARGTYLRQAADWGGGDWRFQSWMEVPTEVVTDELEARLTALEDSPASGQQPETNPAILSDMTGWVAGPTTSATYDLAASDPVIGTSSVKITLDGTAGTGYVDKIGLAPFSMRTHGLTLWLKIVNTDSVQSGSIKVSSTNGFTAAYGASLPITYGGKGPVTEGEWFPVNLSPGNLYVNNGTPDIDNLVALQVRITGRAGMPAPILTIGGISSYQDRARQYPNGVISIAFDDSYASHASIAAPYMARKGFSGTEYLINDRIDSGGGWMTFEDLHRLREVYGWEIGAHASDTAAHTDWRNQTDEWVKTELEAQRAWQVEHGFTTETFAYPIGPFEARHSRAASVHYASARSTYGWTNSSKSPHVYRLSCFVIAASANISAIQTWIDRAVEGGGWVVLMFHDIVESGATGNTVNRALFEQVVDAVADSGLPVAAVGDVIRASKA